MNMGFTSRLVGASVAGLLLAAHSARADLEVGIEAGAGYSDNIRRTPLFETDEKIGTIGLDLLWEQTNRRIEGNATADLAYFEYMDNTFESEVVGIADGSITLALWPERFTWLFRDSFGQAQTDPFSPVTPENRENVNYFTTGPDLMLRFGSAAYMNLFGRYSSTRYERQAVDADRSSAGFALGRRPSQRSDIALNGLSERIDFSDSTGRDYDRDSAFLSYNLDAARTDLNIELGYTWLRPEDDEEGGGLLGRVSVIRDVSASSTVLVEVGTEFTDAGDALRGAIEGGAVGGPDITASADPFENRFLSLRWDFLRNRTGFSLGIGLNEDRYEEQTVLDRTRMAYEASFTRQMTPATDFSFIALLNHEEFDSTGLETDELSLAARLSWQAGRTLGFAVSLERSDRNTSDRLNEYVENRIFMTVTYRPISTVGRSGAP